MGTETVLTGSHAVLAEARRDGGFAPEQERRRAGAGLQPARGARREGGAAWARGRRRMAGVPPAKGKGKSRRVRRPSPAPTAVSDRWLSAGAGLLRSGFQTLR